MVGKKIYGRKRHILTDTQGFILAVKVHRANISDREGAPLLLEGLEGLLTRVSHLFADKGYRGPLRDWIREHLGWETEIVPQQTNYWIMYPSLRVEIPQF